MAQELVNETAVPYLSTEGPADGRDAAAGPTLIAAAAVTASVARSLFAIAVQAAPVVPQAARAAPLVFDGVTVRFGQHPTTPADITDTTAIRAVVATGRYYDRATLDRLLKDVVAA